MVGSWLHKVGSTWLVAHGWLHVHDCRALVLLVRGAQVGSTQKHTVARHLCPRAWSAPRYQARWLPLAWFNTLDDTYWLLQYSVMLQVYNTHWSLLYNILWYSPTTLIQLSGKLYCNTALVWLGLSELLRLESTSQEDCLTPILYLQWFSSITASTTDAHLLLPPNAASEQFWTWPQ